jgi:hypothetical protein
MADKPHDHRKSKPGNPPANADGPDKANPPANAGGPDKAAPPPDNAPAKDAADPFDPANLRLSQNFLGMGGVKKHLTAVPVRKPTREEFVRVHPAAEYTLDTLILELKDSRECFAVSPALWAELSTESTVSPRRLHSAISRQGTLFLWPVKLPPQDGRTDRWSESMLDIVEVAKGNWVRVQADMGVGAYAYFTPVAELPPPEWPAMPFPEILRLAFRSNFVDSLDHPVLRRLRGEV